jgi:hypothetical protein
MKAVQVVWICHIDKMFNKCFLLFKEIEIEFKAKAFRLSQSKNWVKEETIASLIKLFKSIRAILPIEIHLNNQLIIKMIRINRI